METTTGNQDLVELFAFHQETWAQQAQTCWQSCPPFFKPELRRLIQAFASTRVSIALHKQPSLMFLQCVVEYICAQSSQPSTSPISSSSSSSSASTSAAASSAHLALIADESPFGCIAALTLTHPRLKVDLQLFARALALAPKASAANASPTPLVVPYENIARILALPKAGAEYSLVLGLKEPIRQGNDDSFLMFS